MLIPSIDLMGGKIVQLVQGKKKALEFDDFREWVDRFSKYPLVQLIDLDAAIGTGTMLKFVREFAQQAAVPGWGRNPFGRGGATAIWSRERAE